MQYRTFGNTDLEVSEICFGPMRFAAKEESDDDVSAQGRSALEHAIDRGVNFIHSSYEYKVRWSMSRVLKNHPRRHDLPLHTRVCGRSDEIGCLQRYGCLLQADRN